MAASVLIVDDEKETVRMLSTALELFGYQPEVALSGEEALQKCGASPPDAVVLDLMMPGMDGFEVTRRLRASPKTAAIPIVVVTASPEIDAEDRCLQAGANVFLRKPVSIGHLAQVIQDQLDKKAA